MADALTREACAVAAAEGRLGAAVLALQPVDDAFSRQLDLLTALTIDLALRHSAARLRELKAVR